MLWTINKLIILLLSVIIKCSKSSNSLFYIYFGQCEKCTPFYPLLFKVYFTWEMCLNLWRGTFSHPCHCVSQLEMRKSLLILYILKCENDPPTPRLVFYPVTSAKIKLVVYIMCFGDGSGGVSSCTLYHQWCQVTDFERVPMFVELVLVNFI